MVLQLRLLRSSWRRTCIFIQYLSDPHPDLYLHYHYIQDCTDLPHRPDFPKESSAFSSYNACLGPFSEKDPTRANGPSASSSSRKPRRRKDESRDSIAEDGTWADGYGSKLPMDVGKQGKRKERARMEQRARAQEQEDDDEDWFARRGGRGAGPSGDRHGSSGKGPPSRDRERNGKKMTFGELKKDRDRFGGSGSGAGSRYGADFPRSSNRDGRGRYGDLPVPARETDTLSIRGAASRPHRDRDSDRDRDRDRDRRDSRSGGRSYHDREHDYGSSSRNSSRYKGGYSR